MNAYVVCAELLLFALIMAPLSVYILGGLKGRRNEVLAALNAKSIELYFRQYQPGTFDEHLKSGKLKNPSKPALGAFEEYYDGQFGKRHFIMPTVLLGAVALVLINWSALSVLDWLAGNSTQGGHLPELAVAAIMGAYMYLVYDLISRWNASSLSPADILWYAFRLAIAIPTGYALTSAVKTDIAAPVAFLLGAFPMSTIISFSQRLGAKALGQEAVPESGDSELLKLDGIDKRIAARLAAEEISTPLQLAYADPVKLAIRTNLGFTFLTDCVSQALLYIYVLEKFQDFRKTSLRSSYEVMGLLRDMRALTADIKGPAQAKFEAVVSQLNIPKDILKNFVEEIGDDPYTEFLYWVFYQG
ncbi:MAG: hypothetical protein WAW39_07205 [Prosthecobacter sp.]|uniref:hypothetical protein n=1 Tax=Prosthecobacter sp. TaxID=1965333 RepID=UPI003BB1638F